MNAALSVFKCKIYGCYFHFSQSLWRRVQLLGLTKNWYNPSFRLSFKKIQALAFLPETDVIKGFEIIKNECPSTFKPMITYLENNFELIKYY